MSDNSKEAVRAAKMRPREFKTYKPLKTPKVPRYTLFKQVFLLH